MEQIRVAVVGAGQAGLSASYWLTELGVEHILFEKGRSGDSWRHRWDSFCLVTPNWTLNLPNFPYDGSDPDGFIPRDEIVDYVERFRSSFGAPVRDGVAVNRIEPVAAGGWRISTSDGDWHADAVIVASGPYPATNIPPGAAGLSEDLNQIHSHDYRSSASLPDGAVLVVGSGQSGAQIVDDLVIVGREVWLSVSGAVRVPRRYRGKDVARWISEIQGDPPPILPTVSEPTPTSQGETEARSSTCGPWVVTDSSSLGASLKPTAREQSSPTMLLRSWTPPTNSATSSLPESTSTSPRPGSKLVRRLGK